MIIDFHNHYYPPEYLDAVKAGIDRLPPLSESEPENPS